MRYRKFGGKRYFEAYSSLTKEKANKLAGMNRKSGNKARVVKDAPGSYSVFVRR